MVLTNDKILVFILNESAEIKLYVARPFRKSRTHLKNRRKCKKQKNPAVSPVGSRFSEIVFLESLELELVTVSMQNPISLCHEPTRFHCIHMNLTSHYDMTRYFLAYALNPFTV